MDTVRGRAWTGIENGELMRLAGGTRDVFITMDQNLSVHQDVARLPFGVVLLRAASNRLLHLRPLVTALLHAIERETRRVSSRRCLTTACC